MLSLQLANSEPQLGPLVPGVAGTYDASITATLTSSAGNATLSIADADNGTGRLSNGTSEIATPLQVRATNAANPNTAFANLRGLSNPLALLTYNTALANEPVTVTVRQTIAANQALTMGGYSKSVVFILSTSTP
jgi:hypothetical protein